MRFQTKTENNTFRILLEDSFTLIDYLMLFLCLLVGMYFMLFLWIFAIALIGKLFTSVEFEFNFDTYSVQKYFRVFNYLRIKRRNLSFGEIDSILFTNQNSGSALVERGLTKKEWFTIEIRTSNFVEILAKSDIDELESITELHEILKTALGDILSFDEQFIEVN